MKYLCSKLKSWLAIIPNSCNLFCNIVLCKYKQLVETWRGISVLQDFLKHLCWGHVLTRLQVSSSDYRYFKWTLRNLSKSLIYRTPWMTNPAFQPKFYLLITFCLLFLHFFRFIIDNCNYGFCSESV